MGFHMMVWAKDALQVMFFTGLIGCVAVVFLSWVSILRSIFSNSPED
jgi:hypothetical protein